MMRSASREAVANLRRRREQTSGTGASVEALTSLARELYSVADLLVTQPRLRRTLGDPATAPDARAGLAGQLLTGKISTPAVEVVQAAVAERWSSPWDLTDAIERTGDDTLFAAAESAQVLDEVEDQLFRFERVLDGAGGLMALLDESAVDADRRVGLLDTILGDKVHPISKELLEHAVRTDRKRNVTLVIDDLLEAAAERQQKSVARVATAVELTEQQQQRLTTALSELYGRPISVRTALDPTVRGGLLIRVGDEIIDGTIAARLVQARTVLAG